MRPTEAETLASRAIDRALRPLLPRECYGSNDAIEIHCSVQSFDVSDDTLSGDPIAVAINAASSTLLRSGLPIGEPVGAVRLCLDCEGTVTFDPSPEQVESAQLDLLVAATRNDIVMIEFGANAPRAYRDNADNDNETETTIYANRSPGISEEVVADLLRLAHASIQNIIEEQERDAMIESPDNESVSDSKLMAELGLDVSNFPSNILEDDLPEGEDEVAAKQIIEEAFHFISSRLGEAARRFLGVVSQMIQTWKSRNPILLRHLFMMENRSWQNLSEVDESTWCVKRFHGFCPMTLSLTKRICALSIKASKPMSNVVLWMI